MAAGPPLPLPATVYCRHQKKIFIAFLAELGNLESFETMFFFENLKKMTKSPAGLLGRRKIFEKNNMVSNDSKLPNSARNAIKIFFLVAAKNGGGLAAVFFKDTNSWGN